MGGWREPDHELGSGQVWLHDENWQVPVLHFGTPPPVAAKEVKKAKTKPKKTLGTRADEGALPTVEVDIVNHPPHYSGNPEGIECIQITRHMNFNLGNAVKYLWRAGKKDKNRHIEDINKAIWYLQDEIRRLERDPSQP